MLVGDRVDVTTGLRVTDQDGKPLDLLQRTLCRLAIDEKCLALQSRLGSPLPSRAKMEAALRQARMDTDQAVELLREGDGSLNRSREHNPLFVAAATRHFVNQPAELTLSRAGLFPRRDNLQATVERLARLDPSRFGSTAEYDEVRK